MTSVSYLCFTLFRRFSCLLGSCGTGGISSVQSLMYAKMHGDNSGQTRRAHLGRAQARRSSLGKGNSTDCESVEGAGLSA